MYKNYSIDVYDRDDRAARIKPGQAKCLFQPFPNFEHFWLNFQHLNFYANELRQRPLIHEDSKWTNISNKARSPQRLMLTISTIRLQPLEYGALAVRSHQHRCVTEKIKRVQRQFSKQLSLDMLNSRSPVWTWTQISGTVAFKSWAYTNIR